MPIEKKPANPVPKGYHVEKSIRHRVRDGESWETLAERYGIDAKKIIKSNFKTSDPREVNWYLGNPNYVGCKKPTPDGNNWMFSSAADPGIVYIPPRHFEFPDEVIEAAGFTVKPFSVPVVILNAGGCGASTATDLLSGDHPTIRDPVATRNQGFEGGLTIS